MATSDIWLDDVGLLVADVTWERLLAALRATGEGYEVLGPVADWTAWWVDHTGGGPGRVEDLLAGELDGRSYVLQPTGLFAATADRVPVLAAHTGGLVFAYEYFDILGTSSAVAARGDRLLRYVAYFAGHTDDHAEGEPLPGETVGPGASALWDNARVSAAQTEGVRAVLRAHGFDAEGWLARGSKWTVRHTPFDPGRQPDEHAALYFGPLRMRVDAQEEYFRRLASEEPDPPVMVTVADAPAAGGPSTVDDG